MLFFLRYVILLSPKNRFAFVLLEFMRWLSIVNLLLVALIGVTLATLFFFLSENRVETISLTATSYSSKDVLPKNPFIQRDEAYRRIGKGPFALKWDPPEMELPDLRKAVLFYGKNGRPDILSSQALFHIALTDEEKPRGVKLHEKIYLTYEGNFSSLLTGLSQKSNNESTPLWNDPAHNFSKGNYRFSPDNQPTALWIELVSGEGEGAEVVVGMLDDKGSVVSTPSDFRSFLVRSQEVRKGPAPGWEIGGTRVDASLLVRQRARWVGSDIFLEQYGGEEFADSVGREKIDFSTGETPYSCFVKAGDMLIWDKDRWVIVTESIETADYPLLVLKKVNEKVMNFELWDSEGKGKIVLNLIRTQEHEKTPDLLNEFKFVGAKTWAQFIVEAQSNRLVLKPHDWLVLTGEGWHKIESPDEVDDYVNQRLKGPLFILDKMVKKNGRQTLIGQLFNSSRTQCQIVDLPAPQNPLLNNYTNLTLSPPAGEHLISPPHSLKAEIENDGDCE